MSDRQPAATKNLDGYGNPALPWKRASDALNATGKKNDTWYIGTTDPDGRPHAAGVGALWHDDQLFFTSGDGTRKSRNLAANPAASMSISLDGIDLVFEGPAERVTDGPTLEAVADRYRDDGDGWPVKVDGDALTAAFSAPSAGPPPWKVYRLAFEKVFGVATAEPNGATKWSFDDQG
jgi:hypothetical protein